MKLIFNADDLGLSKAVNYGIYDAFNNGVVRSATMMANMPGFEHALELNKSMPGLDIGVHLTLTTGKPVTQGLKSIVDRNGNFLKQGEFLKRLDDIDLDEVNIEYNAQVEKILKSGINITHIDGHHHFQCLDGINNIYIKLLQKYNLPGRNLDEISNKLFNNNIKTTEKYSSDFYGENVSCEYLIKMIENNKLFESMEIMCHPAYVDSILYDATSYSINRIREYDVLTSNIVKNYIIENNIKLCGYASL